MKISLLKRLITVYFIIGKNFGLWLSPIISGILISILRIINIIFMKFDYILFPKLFKQTIKNPVLIVGNPRSGTTFLHRYLVKHNLGTGTQLWKMLFPSIILQKLIYPLLPLLEKFSPTRYHSSAAHKTSLNSVETDDASMLFRFFDGFFLYGFFIAWHEDDLFQWFDPKIRDTSIRDFKWYEALWKRNLYTSSQKRVIGKLFSISAKVPNFINHFSDAKLLYMLRDPLSVIPSGLSLVTGVLDKRFGFWDLPKEKRQHYINRLYKALVELQIRFHDDWINNKIDKNKLMIVHFDEMMNDFEGLMKKICKFTNIELTENLKKDIQETANKQRKFQSGHKYDLEKFGITEKQIKKDCEKIYTTFLK